MSEFIPIDFSSVTESRPVSNGVYNTMITGAEVVKTGEKSKHPGSPQIKVSVGLPDNIDAPNITHYISLPHKEDEERSAKYKILLLKRFLEAYRIPYDKSGIDPARACMEMNGREARLEIQLTPPDEQGRVFNRLILPPLVDD